MHLTPKYPIFIPSKGRYDKNITARAFIAAGIDFTLVVEPQEYDCYKAALPNTNILTTPHSNQGLTVTRNFIWDTAAKMGVERFWTFDDNIYHIYRLNNNKKFRCLDSTPLRVIEIFAERYENLPIVGMNYHGLCKQGDPLPPLYFNTRVYSNMLIYTDVRDANGNRMRNECYYNDDTDLCLRVLKCGYCTVLFNAFLIDKEVTMRHAGGMTDQYNIDRNERFAAELAAKHPDVVKITHKFNRVHHQVDYKPFKKNLLRKKPQHQAQSVDNANNYGLRLIPLEAYRGARDESNQRRTNHE